MMLPPTKRSSLDHPRTRCELTLAEIRRRIALLECAYRTNPLAWLALGLLAIALGDETPLEELERLQVAESLLAAALTWYERAPAPHRAPPEHRHAGWS